MAPALLLALALALLAGCAAGPGIQAPPGVRPTMVPVPTQAPKPAAPREAYPSPPGSQAASVPWDRMIIRTANLSLVVRDVEETLAAIREIARGADGYVASSQSQYRGELMTATVTLQVPVASFDGVVQQIRRLAVRVEGEQTTSQDVTEEYVDLQSQMRNLQAAEASLLKLMERTTKVEEILAVQRELTQVRGQIERAQGRATYLQRRTEMSSLAVTLLPEEAREVADPAWRPLRTVERSWRASLQTVRVLADVALAVLVFSWWLLPLLGLGGWLWLRRRRRGPAPPPVQVAGAPGP